MGRTYDTQLIADRLRAIRYATDINLFDYKDMLDEARIRNYDDIAELITGDPDRYDEIARTLCD